MHEEGECYDDRTRASYSGFEVLGKHLRTPRQKGKIEENKRRVIGGVKAQARRKSEMDKNTGKKEKKADEKRM